jgi:hypothetical protein
MKVFKIKSPEKHVYNTHNIGTTTKQFYFDRQENESSGVSIYVYVSPFSLWQVTSTYIPHTSQRKWRQAKD